MKARGIYRINGLKSLLFILMGYLLAVLFYTLASLFLRINIAALVIIFIVINIATIIPCFNISFSKKTSTLSRLLAPLFVIIEILLTPSLFIKIVAFYSIIVAPCEVVGRVSTEVCLHSNSLYGELYIVKDPSGQIAKNVQDRSIDWRDDVEAKSIGDLGACPQKSFKIQGNEYQVYVQC